MTHKFCKPCPGRHLEELWFVSIWVPLEKDQKTALHYSGRDFLFPGKKEKEKEKSNLSPRTCVVSSMTRTVGKLVG